MRRLPTRWTLSLAGAALVASAVVGHAGALPAAPPPLLTPVSDLQCPTTTLCLGIAGEGGKVPGPYLIVSRAPRSRRWITQTIDGGRRLRVLTCRSARWCLIVDQQNRVLISTDPGHGAASWRLAPGGPGRHLDNVQQLSCPGVHLCVGLAGHYVVSSVAPQLGGMAWSQRLVNPDAPAFTVQCPAITLVRRLSRADRRSAPVLLDHGYKSGRIISVESVPIDERHVLANTRWESLYERTSGDEVAIEFHISYLLREEPDGLKVLVYISHEDERQQLAEHGLLDRAQ
jgi:hypothetical protein